MTADAVTGKMGFLLDRTAVLFLGVAVGVAIGLAFASGTLMPAAPAPATAASTALITAAPPASVATPPLLPIAATKECALRYAPSLTRALTDGRPIRIAVLGDSFGDGLWSALFDQLPKKAGFDVLHYSQQSTGFTRYASLNLEDRLAEQLGEGPIDIAVISFGANDTKGVYANGHGASLLSPAWQAEIGARITRYVTRLRRDGAQVYWVGLPEMRAARFNGDIQGLNDFYAGLMARLDVPFIETRSRSVDASGAYAAYLPDQVTGAPRLMRANDGVHMSMGGYKHLTEPLAARIIDHVAAARREATGTTGTTGTAGTTGATGATDTADNRAMTTPATAS